jgi:serine-type D-Ala-D-Ala carboxypeptidase (penicillin-binding protein 5/6)
MGPDLCRVRPSRHIPWWPAVPVTVALVLLILTAILPAVSIAAESQGRTNHSLASTASPQRESPASSQNPAWTSGSGNPMLEEEPVSGTSSAAMFAVDITRQELLYRYNADQAVAPASTLKIITALTALTVFEPEDMLFVSEADLVDITIFSNAQLQAGDEVSVEDLLAGLMLPSGGDAAKALARNAGGILGPMPGQSPVERFVDEMNDLAQSIGMNDSNFVNPDGPDDPEQYTTARDMAIAGAALLEDDLLADIVASPTWMITVSGANARQYSVANTNQLINVDRVQGIKTGTTGEAGQSIVLATQRGDNQIITVVMGSEGRYEDIEALMGHLDDQIRWVEFGPSSDFPDFQMAAETYRFATLQEFTVPMVRDTVGELDSEFELGPLTPRVFPLRWGRVVFLQDDEELFQVPLLRTGDSTD